MTDSSKLIYSVISDYKCNLSKISLDKRSSKISSFKMPSMNYMLDDKNDKYITINVIHTSYNVTYNFDKIGEKQLCLLTHFLKISQRPVCSTKSKETDIMLSFETVDDNIDNVNFKNIIINIVNKIREDITKLHPDAHETNSPYYDGLANNNFINVHLPSFYDTTNKQNVIIVPIHFHNSKNKGGGVTIIKKDTLAETLNEIMTVMPMFKYSKYGEQPEAGDKLLYYEGKCSLLFNVTVRDVTKIYYNGDPTKRNVYYTIKIYAREIEMKHNVSHVKSILDSGLSYISVDKSLNCLSI